ncbi:MAG: ABC transporter permease [Cytophagales bacterium]|nr:ABC transporter permease [Cytophagales bacterium]
MFDFDKWQEIFQTIGRNKLRTGLTLFGVFWGLFMLMILLGSGSGLRNGVMLGFSGINTNSCFVWGRRTTMPYKGFQPGRFVRLRNDDIGAIRTKLKGVQYVAPRLGRNAVPMNYKEESGSFFVRGDLPDVKYIIKEDVYQGRFLNALDIKHRRKVCVIGHRCRSVLFPDMEPEEIIGKFMKIQGVPFMVIGMFKSLDEDDADYDEKIVHIPLNTFQQMYKMGDRVGWFGLAAFPDYDAYVLETEARLLLAKRHQVHPDDKNALGTGNVKKEYEKIQSLFSGILIFNWVVGIGSLLAGLIGISNIMLITVKERTKEIGIRKALGAKPWSIISLILQESVTITFIAGFVGFFLGFMLTEYISSHLPKGGDSMFYNPEIDFSTALASLGLTVLGGVLAGLIPAQKAAAISPIESLRTE